MYTLHLALKLPLYRDSNPDPRRRSRATQRARLSYNASQRDCSYKSRNKYRPIHIFTYLLVHQPAVCIDTAFRKISRRRSAVEISSTRCHVVVYVGGIGQPITVQHFRFIGRQSLRRLKLRNFVGRQNLMRFCRPILDVRLPTFVGRYYRTIISADKNR